MSAGAPIPTHNQALPRFSTFVGIRVSTGSHCKLGSRGNGRCDKVVPERVASPGNLAADSKSQLHSMSVTKHSSTIKEYSCSSKDRRRRLSPVACTGGEMRGPNESFHELACARKPCCQVNCAGRPWHVRPMPRETGSRAIPLTCEFQRTQKNTARRDYAWGWGPRAHEGHGRAVFFQTDSPGSPASWILGAVLRQIRSGDNGYSVSIVFVAERRLPLRP